MARKRVAALLIGNEILTGKTRDINGQYLAKACFKHGLELRKAVVVRDEPDEIAESVLDLSKRYDFVFTSGGVGPTHDDITYESIAKAFGEKLHHHKSTLSRMEYYFKHQRNPPVQVTEARKRMAFIPENSFVYFASPAPTAELAAEELLDLTILPQVDASTEHLTSPVPHPVYSAPPSQDISSKNLHTNAQPASPPVWVPIVRLNNVHILPGIPALFSQLLDSFFPNYLVPAIKQTLQTHAPQYRRVLGTQMMEGDLAEWLKKVQEMYAGRVSIGSYPQWRPREAQSNDSLKNISVLLSFEGDSQSDVESSIAYSRQHISLVEVNTE